jgi:N-acetylglucosamine malate deacetylase 1
MKVNILAVGVHPDDVELGCAGTILAHIASGSTVAILDLTQGELGTRGSAELRLKEAEAAKKILGVDHRHNLGFADGFLIYDQKHLLKVVEQIRLFQPDIVLCNAPSDRHPDHGKASKLVSDACFYSGLVKVKTEMNGEEQQAWRPKAVYHYLQDRYLKPDVVVDISNYLDKKFEAILAFSSQFYDPGSNEPETPISGKEFLEAVKSRAIDLGRQIGVKYGEGYTAERYVGVKSLTDLL